MFDRENIGGLNIYTEVNQGTAEKLADKTWANLSSIALICQGFLLPMFFTTQ